MTLNLWGRQGEWEGRRSVLRDGLRKMAPDLVAFQEAITTDGYDQAADLLGSEYRVVHQSLGMVGDGNHGASIASRWPVEEVQEVDLHVTRRTTDYPCGMLAANVLIEEPVGPLLFVAYGPSHQLSYEFERERQAVAAARRIEELVGRWDARHVVVAGDFNADPEAASSGFWLGERSLEDFSVCYRDSWESAHPEDPGHTFAPRNPLVSRNKPALKRGRRIDYVLVRCDDACYGPTLDVSACELAFDGSVEGVWASDHFGVVADLAVASG